MISVLLVVLLETGAGRCAEVEGSRGLRKSLPEDMVRLCPGDIRTVARDGSLGLCCMPRPRRLEIIIQIVRFIN